MPYHRRQRVIAFLLALCVFCSGQAFAAPACENNEQALAQTPAEALTCDYDLSSRLPAVNAYQRDLAQLPGHGVIAIARAPHRWETYAPGHGLGVCAAHWLQAPAHDPPKTIRFCTLLN